MPERPNIVLIITDQQRYDTIAALGSAHAVTPHMDRLVEEGASLTGCHVNAPVCAPNRASLFSGVFPHNTGVLRNQSVWPQRTWVDDLATAGYHCVSIGKMHTNPYDAKQGFHERYIVENKDRDFDSIKFYDDWQRTAWNVGEVLPSRDRYQANHPDWAKGLGAYEWALPEHLHPDVFVANNVLWWLDQSDRRYAETSKPLFLEIGFPGPHPPYDPLPSFLDLYRDVDLPLLDVTQEELDRQPQGLQDLRRAHETRNFDAVAFDAGADRERRLRQRRHYMANVSMIDHQIGRVMAALAGKGLLENSLVVLTSDHGDNLGDHGLSQKWNMYDQSVRVPAIFWSPGRVRSGLVVDGLFQTMDIGATVVEAAGLDPVAEAEARSFLGMLEGRAPIAGRDYAFAELARDAVMTEIEYTMMVRSQEWKYVEFLGDQDGQLFHLATDPLELDDLWRDEAHAETRETLRHVGHEWFFRSALQGARWRQER